MSDVEVLTFGCRLNLAEGESVRAIAPEGAVVVNSCAVTAEAVRQAAKAVRKAHRERPDAPIFVTGCAAQLDPARFAAMPGVTRVLGNGEKLRAESYRGLLPAPATSFSPPPEARRGMLATPAFPGVPFPVTSFADRSRAFVQVQTGCDHRCTFCIIPFARGNGRSVPAKAVVDRVAALVDAGAQEVVLTGVDLTGYGADVADAPGLGTLVDRILRAVPGLPRLRLSSLDTIEIDPLLTEIIAGEPRLMPHLHLSLQSGDDMILKRMRRRHGRAHAVATVSALKARRPELAIGADLIAGFPTETASMAANSMALIEECDIVFAHVFPFSARAGTPAARMPQVEPEIARDRARRLREASAARRATWLAGLVGSTQRVLVERGGTGHTESFAKVRLADSHAALDRSARDAGISQAVEVGRIATLRIAAVDGDTLVGVPA